MVKRPTGPFWDASHHTAKRESQLKTPLELNPPRDKDNAGHEIKPPSFAQNTHPQLAPPGMAGYKKPRVGIEQEFKPIVPKSSDKDRDIDR